MGGGYIAYISTSDNEQLSLLARPSNYRDVWEDKLRSLVLFFSFAKVFNFCTNQNTLALAEYFWHVSY